MKKNNIILKASAGTGKTYRLSLEFIANLIRGVNYKNIVVMTFTKKATAEIKERIYDFLHQIAFDEGNGAELEKNLKEIYKFDDLNKKELQNIYFEMIRNKEDIRISTIDGFTNKIFKNAIAPYFNIYNYETLDEETDEFYSKILIKIIENKDNFENFKFIFDEKKEKKNIKRYMEIIKEVLDMRPKFVLTKGFKMSEVKKVSYKFIDELDGIFEKIEEVANKKNKNVTDVLTKAFYNIYEKYSNLSKDESKNENQKIKEKLELIVPEIDLFFEKKLWNGTQTKGEKNKDDREELETKSEELKEKLSEYVFIEKVLPLDKKLKNIVVIHLGTNGVINKESFESSMKLLEGKTVYLMNTVVPKPWEKSVNESLEEWSEGYDNITIIDWYKYAKGEKKLFYKDATHPKPEGAKKYAEFILETIKSKK